MNQPTIQAIPTRYAGYHFRSRLEARWAVVFDTCNWPWEYEPEGFQLPSGWYLPDFRVIMPQSCGCCRYEPNPEWVEVKGETPTSREIALATELAEATIMQVAIVGKIPRLGGTESIWQARSPRSLTSPSGPSRGVHDMGPRTIHVHGGQPQLDAALSARFEHGESGRT